MPLIGKIQNAFKSGALPNPFTVEDLKLWMGVENIVKDDGFQYAPASINAILSNTDRGNIPTTNRNVKLLHSRRNSKGQNEYWF